MPSRDGAHQSLQQTLRGGLGPGLLVGEVEEEVGMGVAGNLGASLGRILLVDHTWRAWEISLGV